MTQEPPGLIHGLRYVVLIGLIVLTDLSTGFAQDRFSGQ